MEKRDIGRILPKSELVESGYLESMLDNFSTSYKLFWFKGIFAEVIKGNTEISYRRIVARMIAAAWYPVNYYNLSLGVSDKLSDAIRYLHTGLGVAKEIREDALVTVIEESGDKCLWKMINGFTGMVPYRLIRPFYESEIQYQKKTDLTFRDARVNAFIEQCNRSDDGAAFYRLDRKNRKLTVSPKWALYIRTNAALVEGWLNYKLIKYIQERNPNVPAIPFKLFAPTERYSRRCRFTISIRNRNLTGRTLTDTGNSASIILSRGVLCCTMKSGICIRCSENSTVQKATGFRIKSVTLHGSATDSTRHFWLRKSGTGNFKI